MGPCRVVGPEAILAAAMKNAPLLKNNVFRKQNASIPQVRNINERYAAILENEAWVKVPCNLEEYFAGVAEIFKKAEAALVMMSTDVM